jgi:predicted O-methyltransferase YrrM
LDRALERESVPFRSLTLAAARAQSEAELSGLACVVLGEVTAERSLLTATQLVHHPALGRVPLEHVAGLEPERRLFTRRDEYPDTFFISPVLSARPSPYELYEESLAHFEQKCGLRDYLDLYQWLSSIQQRNVPGAVAEFGSYRGHSGWLIARTMQSIGLQKRLYLFDTFESFPDESAGVDHFWSRSHPVDFDEVRAKLAPFTRAELVRGDFTETWPGSGTGALALAYVDCDSYRAVSYVANLFEDAVSPGGVMIFEDYGHPALLGCRIAVHEYFDGRTDCLQFFSQFSGLYVVVKTGM